MKGIPNRQKKFVLPRQNKIVRFGELPIHTKRSEKRYREKKKGKIS